MPTVKLSTVLQAESAIGFTGSQGSTGYTGSVGSTGGQGNTGYTGSRGLLGVTGSTGFTGSAGTDGYTGSRGDVGYTGSQGNQGTTGYTGSFGTTGYTGSQGTTGYVGSRGDTGYSGSKGDTGLGFNIAKTYASVAALTADTSPTGITTGEFALINTGNVEDAENSRLYLWNGSSYTYVNDLSGAAGIMGPVGSVGYTGSRGTDGYTGSQGTAGYTGSRGTDGYTGSQGNLGYTGSQGSQGTTGYTGSQGNTGYTGSHGDLGYTGSQGDTGYTGSAATLTNWSKKTSNYTAISGDRIVADTTSGSFSVTLPATPSIGSYVQISDGGNFAANSLTVLRNGSTIEGISDDVLINIKAIEVEFFYDGSTWQIVSTFGPKGFTGSSGSVANVVTGDFTVTDTLFVGGNIIPTSNNTVNIGSDSYRFNTLYVAANTINLGGTTLSAASGALVVGTPTGNITFSTNVVNFLSNVSISGSSGANGYTGSAGSAGVNGYTGSAGSSALIYDVSTNATGFFAVPSGTTAQRPGVVANGYIRYNTTTGYGEMYTLSGWAIIGQGPPLISTVTPSTFNGESGTSFSIQGSNFTSDATVKFISNSGTEYTAGTVTFINSGEITATTPQDFTVADEPLDVKIIQNSGQATKADVIDCGGSPSWSTASGSLGTYYDNGNSVSVTVTATDPDAGATITYSVTSGTLPSGITLNSSTGAITGTTPSIAADTTYNFTIRASDNAGNYSDRSFSMVLLVSNYFGSGADGAGSF